MRPRFASLAAFAALGALGAATLLVPARPASAAEPYDSSLLAVLASPGPEFTEIDDPADASRTGPLDDARMAQLDMKLPDDSRTVILGAVVRGDTSATNRVLQVAYELKDAAHARTALEGLPTVGTAFRVQGIPGAVGRAVDSPPVAYVAFALANRSFFLVVGGPDPGHALLQDTALQVVNTAAENLAGGLAADMGGGPLDDGEASSAPASGTDSGGLRETLKKDDVRLALAAVAALMLYVLARRGRPAPRPAPAAPFVRGGSQVWRGQTDWVAAAAPPPSVVPLGGPVAGGDAFVTYDSGWSGNDAGWGDEDGVEDPAGSPSVVPPPQAATSWPAPPTASLVEPNVSVVPVAAEEHYSFPGADVWPDDGEGRP